MKDDNAAPTEIKPNASRTPLPTRRNPSLISALFVDASPIDLRLVGRTIFHAALVGVGAGLVAVAFYACLERVDRFVLGQLAGYRALRAAGESFLGVDEAGPFRPLLLAFLPAIGGLLAGLVTRIAPECR